MNVGIIAACLPTLKPLAANFFGVVSALTSGERYGSRYGSRHTRNARSRLHISNGYLKQSERSEIQSYSMGELKNDAARLKAAGLHEHQVFADGKRLHEQGQRRGSSAADSDESILHHHTGIMRTTEVRIS